MSNQDAFSSVSTHDMPFTLNSHWSPLIYKPFTSLSYSPTFRSHYVRIPSPGDYFVTADEVNQRIEKLIEDNRSKATESCTQS